MVAMWLPLSSETIQLLYWYDTFICLIFLVDFYLTLQASPRKSDYFIKQRGWLDLLGSIPSFGVFRFGALLRLARLSRFVRIIRLLRQEEKKQLVADLIRNRSQYAGVFTVLLILVVLMVTSVLVLQFESISPDANIHTGWDAFWYSMVTITTVGYGDRYPVTIAGRITAMFIMIAGVGIIGALASILSSFLVGGSPAPEEGEKAIAAAEPTVDPEITALRQEVVEMRQLLDKIAAELKIRS
jgi:voltage-gated potassium channel